MLRANCVSSFTCTKRSAEKPPFSYSPEFSPAILGFSSSDRLCQTAWKIFALFYIWVSLKVLNTFKNKEFTLWSLMQVQSNNITPSSSATLCEISRGTHDCILLYVFVAVLLFLWPSYWQIHWWGRVVNLFWYVTTILQFNWSQCCHLIG